MIQTFFIRQQQKSIGSQWNMVSSECLSLESSLLALEWGNNFSVIERGEWSNCQTMTVRVPGTTNMASERSSGNLFFRVLVALTTRMNRRKNLYPWTNLAQTWEIAPPDLRSFHVWGILVYITLRSTLMYAWRNPENEFQIARVCLTKLWYNWWFKSR